MTASESRLRLSLRNGGILTAIVAAAWAASAAIAWALAGPHGALQVSIAAVLCLTPGWLVFAFTGLYVTAAPLGGVIVGMVARMAAVLCGAVVLKAVRPDLADLSFAVWLGLFYVLALAVETKLLLTPPARGTSPDE